MVPDVLLGNTKFLDSLSDEEYDVFMEAAHDATELEMSEWDKAVEEAYNYAKDVQGVEFIDVDIEPFREKVHGVQQDMIKKNPGIEDMYEHIQKVNKEYEDKNSNTSSDTALIEEGETK